ncbi:nascent polypeptide-associated complex subunit alpha, muscle-specific form-like isoform X2 [Bradysia coprophila]|uniref:nascent polypeptide-associated complex subunit alpha, muscle-specific form-like isoform X2 n=1 Tax=Bradysia coprophila TaxID=38358 RepID=UPI00187DA6A8|nr:nascent polypeptide-associated complex subunit alpha, muscle-specific form-like isoform X2 [Bradysia coprophila]
MNSKQTVCVTWFCVFLLLSSQFTNIDARKQPASTKKTGTGSHVTRTSSSSNTDTKNSNSHADQAKLSYAGYNSAPNPPKAQQPAAAAAPPPPPPPPAAPVHQAPAATPDANKPAVGWNVPDSNVQRQTVHNTNAAPYPQQPQQSGPPPPYSPHSNVNSHPHDSPPPYQQHAGAPSQYPGAPVGGYPQQQGGYPQQQGGFPQQQGGFPPQQGGYPQQQGGFPQQQGGYPQQQGGFPPQQGYPAGQPYPVVQQPPQKSSGSGLQTALIAGVGGLALYGALKPSGEKVIVINNGESTTAASSSDATTAASVAPAAPAAPASDANTTNATPVSAAVPVAPVASAVDASVAPVPLASVPPPADNGVSVTPVAVLPSDSTTVSNSPMQPIPSDGNTPLAPLPPLAPFPVTVTMAPSDIPPFSGSAIHYDQIPLAPLAPFPSSQPPPICAPGQNPDDPLMKCTPLTVAPMYVTPSSVAGTATAQQEVGIPVASNTNQNLQAQSALKSGAVSCTLVAINLVIIPILTVLMV